jgi:hypothetical protein
MLFLTVPAVQAQQPPDTLRKVRQLHQVVERYGAQIGPRVWPGFRPDTIPTVFVIAGQGKLLTQWRHELLAGFHPWPGEPMSSWSLQESVAFPSGRFIAFMSIDGTMSLAYILGTDIHEAFHSFEHSAVREGSFFGRGENSMLIGSYPVFDTTNEALFSMEGGALHRALIATDRSAAAQAARDFLTIRARRHARLPSEIVQFEEMAEMNEGLAQYALLRGMAEIARVDQRWNAGATSLAQTESALLDSLLAVGRQSSRRRFYATGSAMGLVLDNLVGEEWKDRIMKSAITIDQVLAQTVGLADAGTARESWNTDLDHQLALHQRQAAASVELLRRVRRAQADSIIQASGQVVVLDPALLPSRRFQWCGFVPQNLLQTGDGRTIHMRLLQVCGGSVTSAQFSQPAVQDSVSGTLTTVIPVSDHLDLRESGAVIPLEAGLAREVQDLRLTSAGIDFEIKHARIAFDKGVLHIQAE